MSSLSLPYTTSGTKVLTSMYQRPNYSSVDEESYNLTALKDIKFEPYLREMMFGFGDSAEPFPQTVKIMEDLTKDFITRLSLRCIDIASRTHRGMDTETIQLAVKSREDYWERLTELLTAFEEISKGTRFKQTDEDSHDRSSKRSIKASSTSSSKRSKKSESTANDDSASVI